MSIPAANEDISNFLFAIAPPRKLQWNLSLRKWCLLSETALARHRAVGGHSSCPCIALRERQFLGHFGACASPASHPTSRHRERDVERDVQRHELGCQKVLLGPGSASDRGPWQPSDARPLSAQDAGLQGTAIFRQRVVRSDGGDRRPQAALRPCPWWAAARGAALARPSPGTGAFATGDSRRSRTSGSGTGAAR